MLAIVLFFGVILINILMAFLHKKSKIVTILSFVLLMIFFAYAGTEIGDLKGYEREYYNPILIINRYEAGWVFLNGLFLQLGFSFEQFRIVLFFICFICFLYGFRAVKDQPHLLISLFTLYLFYFMSVSLRFTVTIAFVFVAISFLQRKKLVPYVLFIGVAMLFHVTAVSFYIFLVMFLPDKSRWIEKAISIINIFAILFLLIMLIDIQTAQSLVNMLLLLIQNVMDVMFNNNLYLKRYSEITIYGIAVVVRISSILIIYLNYYLVKRMNNRIQNNSIDEKLRLFSSQCERYSLISLIFIPWVAISQTPVRLLFPSILIFIEMLSITYSHMESDGRGILITNRIGMLRRDYLFIVYLSAFIWFVSMYTLGGFGFDIEYFLSTNKLF